MRTDIERGDVVVKRVQTGMRAGRSLDYVCLVPMNPHDQMLYRRGRKGVWLRLHTGTVETTWWDTREGLPRKYEYVGTLPTGIVDGLIRETREAV